MPSGNAPPQGVRYLRKHCSPERTPILRASQVIEVGIQKEGLRGMDNTVNIGVVGVGAMANSVHLPSLAEMEDVHIAALCDLIEERARKGAERFGVDRIYIDYKEMIEQEDLDALTVLVRPHQMFDIVMHALGEGLDVFMEKPPGTSTFQARSMARKARDNQCLTMVGLNRRYIPVVQYVRQKVLERTEVTQVMGCFYKKTSALFYEGPLEVVYSDSIHCIDMIRWLAGGEPLNVATVERQFGDVVPNSWCSVIKFDNGATGVFMSNYNTARRRHAFEMHGPGVSAYLNLGYDGVDEISRIITPDDVEELDMRELAGSQEFHKHYGFFQENRHFIDCVKSRQRCMTDLDEVVKTYELLDMVKHSVV